MGKLGDTLRERRQALGISLEEAQDGTRIRAKLLNALEEGSYDRLPNPGYVRGYVSSYARFLELDPVPLLNMYKAESGVVIEPSLNLPQAGPRVVAPTGQQHAVSWRTGFTVALAVALLALAVWGVTRIWRGPDPTAPEPNVPPATTSTPEAQDETETTPEAPTQETTPPETAGQPFTLTVKVADSAASWLRIEIDGKRAYEGVLAGGQTKEYEVAEKATVRIGKPESVTVQRDGADVAIRKTEGVGVITLDASEPTP